MKQTAIILSRYPAAVTSGDPLKGLSIGIHQGIVVDSSVSTKDLNFDPLN